ncbi:MAG: bifunctional folylpolyglutamate synthase/dihydrofolate synthase [Bacteroidales bacterium]|nr:bifunctional folylpolyglutamate synthase/dihydrofolate synthase [Bacteroidales bacterium]
MEYEQLVQDIFRRFPSVQKEGFKPGAYKPGLEGVRDFDKVLGSPSSAIKTIHVAGTNGKGSVANMLAAALSAGGYRTGLYTSPHLVDFRERCRIDGEMIPKEYVHAFLEQWKPYFEAENLSFFEITTGMAFRWFADSHVDVAVIECGLGGRLDSTNIITPVLSVITSIGLDHCALLGNTLAEIAAEKAGIMKPGVPCVIGETHPETAPVFDNCAASFHAGSVTSCQATKTPKCVASDVSHIMPGHKNAQKRGLGVQLVYADQAEAPLWERKEEILAAMDLQAPAQRKNLRTVLCALNLVRHMFPGDEQKFVYGIEHTVELMHFHGRWERLKEKPLVVADIGHNAHALRNNFEALEATGRPLIIVYGIMADKDLDSIIPLMPRKAKYIFVTPDTPRALPAEVILDRWLKIPEQVRNDVSGRTAVSVADGVRNAIDMAMDDTIIYIGGSTFVVAEALPLFFKGTELD